MADLHAMIDIETMDTEVTAVVLSVGVLVYDPLTIRRDTLDSCPRAYFSLDIRSQLERGRTIGGDTMVWWSQQSAEARSVFTEQPKLPPAFTLGEIAGIMDQYKVQNVWGNGVDFDNAIINSLAKSFGVTKPLNYKHNRCFRTLRAMFKQHIPDHATMPMGTHHNALDDAIYQAVQHGYIHRANNSAVYPDSPDGLDLIESAL